MKISSVLGMNARNQLYTRHNTLLGKRIARSKILSFRTLKKVGIATPEIYEILRSPQAVWNYDWQKLPASFALKPSKGFGGEGIIVVKRKSKDGKAWITTQRKKITVEDLKLHTLDILEGAYSLGNAPDVAFIQEYVGRHKAFRKYAYRGTPDVRVIVFNKVPVMAMLRLPTEESGGRANLHQGAIGVGIDIATGITTKAIWHGEVIKVKPDSDRKLHGIKIPNWTKILEMAVQCQEVTHLGYLGADIVLHPDKGPMILEINSQPGLQIQLANMHPLKRRLERVDELDIRDAEHGVKIAKSLFAGNFADRVKAEEGIKTIKAEEPIKILTSEGKKRGTIAKIDTGAWSSSIDKDFAKELGLLSKDKILLYRTKRSALGVEERPVIEVAFWLSGRKIKTRMSIASRKALTNKVLLGRIDLAGFLVNPEIDEKELEEATGW